MREDNAVTVTLISKQEVEFVVPLEVAKMSELVSSLVEESDDDDNASLKVPLMNVSTAVLRKVIDFCTHYQEVEPMRRIEKGAMRSTNMADVVQPWYAAFVDETTVTKEELFELLLAANYMNIEALLNLTGPAIATRIMGKTTEEMRAFFHIQNDFTPEEEAKARESFEWCESSE